MMRGDSQKWKKGGNKKFYGQKLKQSFSFSRIENKKLIKIPRQNKKKSKDEFTFKFPIRKLT